MKTAEMSVDIIESRNAQKTFCTDVIERGGQPIFLCYQCQRCGGGCPVAPSAGTTPNLFLRQIQFGLTEDAQANPLLWLCIGCKTCGTRCPNKICTGEVIDAFRVLRIEKKSAAKNVKSVRTFHRLFLKQVYRFGRIHEAFLISLLKLKTFSFFKDIGLGLRMFWKGKIRILPHRLRGIPDVKSAFRNRRSAK